MDRYFYSIENVENEKGIYISGNIYFNDVDESETNYRIAEWVGFYLTISELRALVKDDKFFDYINEKVTYLDNITKKEAEDMCNTYWDGKSGNMLDINKVTENTLCGYYWFE